MVYTLKLEGKKYAYDTASGAVVTLPSLPFKMVEALEPPIEPVCPTSLRYELAKYDFSDVEAAYDTILEYAESGLLYKEDDGVIRIMTDGEYACPSERIATELLTKAFSTGSASVSFEAIGEGADKTLTLAQGIAKSLGKEIA